MPLAESLLVNGSGGFRPPATTRPADVAALHPRRGRQRRSGLVVANYDGEHDPLGCLARQLATRTSRVTRTPLSRTPSCSQPGSARDRSSATATRRLDVVVGQHVGHGVDIALGERQRHRSRRSRRPRSARSTRSSRMSTRSATRT